MAGGAVEHARRCPPEAAPAACSDLRRHHRKRWKDRGQGPERGGAVAVLGPCHRSSLTTNDYVGIAETVLGTTRAHRFSVVELSATEPGCLDRPLRLVRARIGVLTLVARDHFSRFKSVEAIAAEKGKVISALPPDGIAVLNIDDPLVRTIGERCGRRVIWIGQGEGATLRLCEARSRYPAPLTLKVEYAGRTYEVATALHGTQLALSVLAALGVGLAAGVPLESAIAVLAQAPVAPGRMQIMKADDGVVFARDDWKAPLWSFHAPLEFMREAQAARKVVVIGTLSDYSVSASKLYPKIARQALEVGELVLFVGPHALRAPKGATRSRRSCVARLSESPRCGSVPAQRTSFWRPGVGQGLAQGGPPDAAHPRPLATRSVLG